MATVLAPVRPHSRKSWLWLASIILAALLIFMPLRLALGLAGETGLSARVAGGTIWSGRLVDARLGELDIGTIDTSLRPLPLLLGRLRLDGTRIGGAPLAGSAETGWGRRAVYDLTGSFSGGELGDVPVGQVTLEGVTIIFSGGRCAEAGGRVRLALAGNIAEATLPSLSGTARCDNGALLLPLTGDSGVERLNLRIDGDGRYTGTLGTGAAIPTIRIEGRL
jgi:general secretion pathway protein N